MKIISRIFSFLAIMTACAVIMAPSVHSQPAYTLTELSLGGTWGTAVCLNEAGQVTGRWQDTEGHGQAFFYDPATGMQTLALGGASDHAYDINDAGQVARYGQTASGETHAFLYDPAQGLKDLNDVVSGPKGFVIQVARSINEKGQILWEGYSTGQNQYQPLLLQLEEVACCGPSQHIHIQTISSQK
jgi:probable HAF family extracellular repeat protein